MREEVRGCWAELKSLTPDQSLARSCGPAGSGGAGRAGLQRHDRGGSVPALARDPARPRISQLAPRALSPTAAPGAPRAVVFCALSVCSLRLCLAMTTQQIVLQGPGPWGFRLVGGKDFEQPLAISRVRASWDARGNRVVS